MRAHFPLFSSHQNQAKMTELIDKIGGILAPAVQPQILGDSAPGILLPEGKEVVIVLQPEVLNAVRDALDTVAKLALKAIYNNGGMVLVFVATKTPLRIVMNLKVGVTDNTTKPKGQIDFLIEEETVTLNGQTVQRLKYTCTKSTFILANATIINSGISSGAAVGDIILAFVSNTLSLDLTQLFLAIANSAILKARRLGLSLSGLQALGQENEEALESKGVISCILSLSFDTSGADPSVSASEIFIQSATARVRSAPSNPSTAMSSKYFKSTPHGVTVQVDEQQIIRIFAATDIDGLDLADVVMGYYLVNVPVLKDASSLKKELGECYPESALFHHHLVWSEGEGDVWTRYLLKFGLYVVGTECTFLAKAQAFRIANYPALDDFEMLGRISLYGLLRYFLWFLITGHWDLNILKRTHTNTFYAILLASDYAIFYEAFSDPQSEIYGLDVAFIA